MAAMVTIYGSVIQYIGCEIFGNTGVRHYVMDSMQRKTTNERRDMESMWRVVLHTVWDGQAESHTVAAFLQERDAWKWLDEVVEALQRIDIKYPELQDGRWYEMVEPNTTANDGSANKGE